jgi:hypothetical protein
MYMRELKRRWKSRRGNDYPTEVVLIASVAYWIVALILWFCI